MSESPDLKDERRRRLIRAVARAATSGNKIGMWEGRLDALLNGELRPSSLDLALIAEAAGVTVAWLLDDEAFHELPREEQLDELGLEGPPAR